MRKRSSFISVLTMFLALGLILVFSRPVKAAANGITLKANRTYTAYDVTGDGVKDKIRIKTVADETEDDEIYKTLVVSVNGKTAFRLKDTRFYYVNAEIYTLKNGQPLLYLYTPAENGDGPVCALLKYSNGKFRKILDFTTLMDGYGNHQIGEVISISGNKIVITESVVSYSLGVNDINFTYKYANGKFVPASRYGAYKAIYSNGQKNRYFTANNELPAYSRPGSTTVSKVLETGTLVKIIKCAIINGKMYIQLEGNGEILWINALNTPPIDDSEKQFMEVTYAG